MGSPPYGTGDRPVHEYLLDLPWRETRARAVRAVYESSPRGELVDAVQALMVPGASVGPRTEHILGRSLPFLQDVLDARPGTFEAWDGFLRDWRERLGKTEGARARALEAEAAYLAHGLEAVAALARERRAQDGVGYLYWIELLRRRGAWAELASVCREALGEAKLGEHRLGVAESLTEAGRQLPEDKSILDGLREAFSSETQAGRLVDLLEQARRLGRESVELEGATGQLEREAGGKSLYVAALLAVGKIAEAWSVAGGQAKAVGWSYEDSGVALLFSGVLVALCGRRVDQAPAVRALLAQHTASIHDSDGRLAGLILRGLSEAVLPAQEAARHERWVESLVRKRVEAIVSEKHRSAYGRAALALCAMAECLSLRGQAEHALLLVEHFRDDVFRRHRAFRAELDASIGTSPILKRAMGG